MLFMGSAANAGFTGIARLLGLTGIADIACDTPKVRHTDYQEYLGITEHP